MKETTAVTTGLACEQCGATIQDENGSNKIECACCGNTLFADDEIICCDDELPRSADNPISPAEAYHYCSQDCYDDHKDEREQYHKDLMKGNTKCNDQ